MSRVKNSDPKFKILSLLATHPEFEQYKMKKEVYEESHEKKKKVKFPKTSYPTILTHLGKLEDDGYIKFRTEPSEKGGKERKIYSLTYKGLWLALNRNIGRNQEDMETIINTHFDKLLTFKKWPLFKQAGIDKIILLFLEKGLWTLEKQIYLTSRILPEYPIISFESEEAWRESVDTVILYPLIADPSYVESFMAVCKSDKELSAFVEGFLTKQLDVLQEEVCRLKEVKAIWDR